MSVTPDSPSDLTRRTVLRRAAAAGLLAVPAAGLLSACATGGDSETQDQSTGTKTADNPLGVKEDAALEVVIFNGGYGDKYATDVHEPLVQEDVPEGEGQAHGHARRSPPSLQPRFAGGTPPDIRQQLRCEARWTSAPWSPTASCRT